MADRDPRERADWLHPPAEQEGLTRYVATIRERIWIVVLAVLVTTAAAVAYVALAPRVYEATADVLVTPVSSDDAPGLPLIRESAAGADVETAARLVTTTEVAAIVRDDLGDPRSPRALLLEVSAEPVAQSSIVAITASGDSPEAAKELTDAFARAAVEQRTSQLHGSIDERLPGMRQRLAALQPGSATADDLAAQVSRYETLRSGPDPTLTVETLAQLPTAPASPRPLLSIAGGLFAGIVLGIGAAFASQVLDPRLRREEQLRRQYRLPILARVPREPRARGGPLGPSRLSSRSIEAYRTLRGTLASTRSGSGAQALLVTGSSPSEGKTTTAVNLAASLALAGKRVILIEADLRRPSIGPTMGVSSPRGVVSVMIESAELGEALVTTPTYGPNLQLLLADYEGGWIAELFTLPAGERMIEEARRIADYVIIDSPPLTEVVDALPLARAADEVLIVVRLGRSRLANIAQLGELLAENGIRPAGFAVIGVPRTGGPDYYYVEAGSRTRAEEGRPLGSPEPAP